MKYNTKVIEAEPIQAKPIEQQTIYELIDMLSRLIEEAKAIQSEENEKENS